MRFSVNLISFFRGKGIQSLTRQSFPFLCNISATHRCRQQVPVRVTKRWSDLRLKRKMEDDRSAQESLILMIFAGIWFYFLFSYHFVFPWWLVYFEKISVQQEMALKNMEEFQQVWMFYSPAIHSPWLPKGRRTEVARLAIETQGTVRELNALQLYPGVNCFTRRLPRLISF